MLDVDAGALDVLAMGDDATFEAKAGAAGIAITGRHGRAEVDVNDVAALVANLRVVASKCALCCCVMDRSSW